MSDQRGARVRTTTLAVALMLTAASAGAGEIEGVTFADRVSAGDRVLELRSLGLLRYRIFFRGYVAALYLEESTPASDVLEPVLELAMNKAEDGFLAKHRRREPVVAKAHRE